MEDIDQLLEDLRSAKTTYNNNKKPQQQEQLTSAENRTNVVKAQTISELDSLLEDLRINSANNNNRNSSNNNIQTNKNKLETLIDTLDDDHGRGHGTNIQIANRNSNANVNIQPEASSQVAKELEDLMNSLASYKIKDSSTNNYDHQTPSLSHRSSTASSSSNTTTTTQKNLCNGCGEPISGQVITALGALWHPAHFICHFCNGPIGSSVFYEKDGRPYCEIDYLNLFSPKCANCSEPILDQMLTAIGKTWHLDCFTCSACGKMLNDESFLEHNQNSFCRDCYQTKLAPQCQHCHKPIIENFISAMGSYWHENCFVCTECGIAFNTSSFFEFNNLPYCELDYHLKRGSLCSSCQQPINGRCITAMNRKFHPEHFICAFCTKQLSKGTFKEKNDKPYCHPCFTKLFPV